MGHYDHRVHAGNAGDVWKHFLLLEAADCLLTPDSSLVYAESHVGRPKYALKPPGEWESGIGRIWSALPLLKDFPYFSILAELNSLKPFRPLQIGCYLGSALLVAKLAERKKADLMLEIWDTDPEVGAAWIKDFDYECLDRFPVSFHLEDGFSGTMSLLKRAPPGLLLIDPPFTTAGEREAAEELFRRARGGGWTVLCWHMTNSVRPSSRDHSKEFSIQFSQIGFEYPGATGCSIRASSPDRAMISLLSRRVNAFLSIIKRICLKQEGSVPNEDMA